MNKSILFAIIFLICGCASVTVFKPGYPENNPDQVKIILDNDDSSILPDCKAEQIGHISTAWEWSGSSAIKTAKEKAAQMGGDYIKGVLHINNVNDGLVEGVVYRCIK